MQRLFTELLLQGYTPARARLQLMWQALSQVRQEIDQLKSAVAEADAASRANPLVSLERGRDLSGQLAVLCNREEVLAREYRTAESQLVQEEEGGAGAGAGAAAPTAAGPSAGDEHAPAAAPRQHGTAASAAAAAPAAAQRWRAAPAAEAPAGGADDETIAAAGAEEPRRPWGAGPLPPTWALALVVPGPEAPEWTAACRTELAEKSKEKGHEFFR